MATQKLSPIYVKTELERLISETSSIIPELAVRLTYIKRAVKDYRPADIIARKNLLVFLSQLIIDSDVYLAIKTSTEEQVIEAYSSFTCSERYWYDVAFPAWFSKNDSKLNIWLGELKANNPRNQDSNELKQLQEAVKILGGNCYFSIILDYSMATDLLVAGKLSNPLAVQLTKLHVSLCENKEKNWEQTLRYWGLSRGLFISCNPHGAYGKVSSLAEFMLERGDNLPTNCYHAEYS